MVGRIIEISTNGWNFIVYDMIFEKKTIRKDATFAQLANPLTKVSKFLILYYFQYNNRFSKILIRSDMWIKSYRFY